MVVVVCVLALWILNDGALDPCVHKWNGQLYYSILFPLLYFTFLLLSVFGAPISPFLSPQVTFQNDLFSCHTKIGIGHLTTTTAIIFRPFQSSYPAWSTLANRKTIQKNTNKPIYAAPVAWSKKSRDRLRRGKGGKAGFAARWCMISGDFAGAMHH